MATDSPRLKEIIELIHRHLDAHELPQAVDLTETHQELLSKAPPKQRLTLLHNLPQRVRQTSPHLLALEAEALVEQGNLKEAVDIFDAARLLFLASNQKKSCTADGAPPGAPSPSAGRFGVGAPLYKNGH
uniref:Tetratricopeptide repeat protein n=1 Tax=Caldilinea aerophila TaxID=133453 RepID=A0A7C1FNR5_9CHLR